MANVVSSFRNLTKIVLLWGTLIAISASLYGALLAGQSGPRTLQLAEDAPESQVQDAPAAAVAVGTDLAG